MYNKKRNAEYYLKKLCQFPHRGCPSAYERKAADVIFSELKEASLNPKIERFKTDRNRWFNNSVHYFLFSLSAMFLVLKKPWMSLITYIIAMIYFLIKMKTEEDVLGILFYSWSQNVLAKVPSLKKNKRKVILLGHYDSPHTTLALNPKWMVPLSKKLLPRVESFPKGFRTPFLITNFVLYTLPVLIIFIILGYQNFVITFFGFFCMFILLSTTILLVHTAFSPFVPGALDNGSGAAVVMALASYFKNKPLMNTEIWFLLNGAEENGLAGSRFFCKKYGENFNRKNTFFINLDGVGASQLRFATREVSPFFFEHDYDEHIISLAKRLAKKPKFKGTKSMFFPLTSDGKVFIQNGFRGLYIFSTEDYGYAEYYHQMGDTISNINFKGLKLANDFVKELIIELDSEL